MDVIGGLTAARLALDLAKDLRDIDQSVDHATYKLKLADRTSALADTQVALSDAKLRIAELEQHLSRATGGDPCPICRDGRLTVVDVEKHDYLTGIEYHTSQCDSASCDYRNTREYDANTGRYVPNTRSK